MMLSNISGGLPQLFSHPKVIQVELAVRRRGGQLMFALGLLIYLCAQVGLVLLPALNRSVPVEADDAYVYVLKAVEMQSYRKR
jgi:hypothetical protein